MSSFASSYIPTTDSAVTRTKDTLKNDSTVINTNNFCLQMQYSPLGDNVGTPYIWGTYVDASNSTSIFHDGTNFVFRKRIAGVNYDSTIAYDYDANEIIKIGVRASSTAGIDIFVNGTKGTNNANTTAIQKGTTYEIGSDGNGGNQANGLIKTFKYFSSVLTDATLIRGTQ